MKIEFLFQRGATVGEVARIAGVNPSTASRWKRGRRAEWPYICRLYEAGLLTDSDLRAAGLSIPKRGEPGTSADGAATDGEQGAA